MIAEPSPEPAVRIERGEAFVLARLCDPPANPLGPPLLDGLDAAVDAVEDGGAHALVIASSLPDYFAAGADIKHMRPLDPAGFAAYGVHMRRVFDRIADLPAISIAAIDGLALGGGFELALACTLRIGSTQAKLGLPEVKLGLIPGAGGTQRLPRILKRGQALDMLLTGRSVRAEEAHIMGLIDRLVPAGTADQVAIEIAHQLSRSSAPALEAIHRCVDAAESTSLEDGMAVEAAEEQKLFEDGEAREGIAAFVERRVPSFRRGGEATLDRA